MKKINLLLFSLLFAVVGYSQSTPPTAVESVGIVGDACDAGWDPGSRRIMTKADENTFTWTGVLYGKQSTNKGARFKFLTINDWNPHIDTDHAVEGYKMINTTGEEVELFYYTKDDKAPENVKWYDTALQVERTGYYTVTLKWPSLKVSIVPANVEIPENIFIVGNAANEGEGTTPSTSNVQQMEKTEFNGVYKWTGKLTATADGDDHWFAFLGQKGTWDKALTARKQGATFGPGGLYQVDMTYRPTQDKFADPKFRVTETGIYTIYVDFNRLKMSVISNNLYMIGNATPYDWGREPDAILTKSADGVFTWAGSLKTGNFKFLTTLGEWYPAITSDDTKQNFELNADQLGVNQKVSFVDMPNGYGQDRQFVVKEAGNYIIKVDLNNMTMMIEKDVLSVNATDPRNIVLTGGWSSIRFNYYADKANVVSHDMKGITTGLTGKPSTLNPNCLIYINNQFEIVGTTNVISNGKAAKIEINDAHPFYLASAISTKEASYTRDISAMNADGWASLCLPFAATTNSTIERFKEHKGATISFEAVDVIEAGKPYIVQLDGSTELSFSATSENADIEVLASDGASFINKEGYNMFGTFEQMSGKDKLILKGDGSEFAIGDEGATIPAFRGYITNANGSYPTKALSIVHEGEVTNMASTSNDELTFTTANGTLEVLSPIAKSVKVYGLAGTLVDVLTLDKGLNTFTHLPKGIYIIENQKITIK